MIFLLYEGWQLYIKRLRIISLDDVAFCLTIQNLMRDLYVFSLLCLAPGTQAKLDPSVNFDNVNVSSRVSRSDDALNDETGK